MKAPAVTTRASATSRRRSGAATARWTATASATFNSASSSYARSSRPWNTNWYPNAAAKPANVAAHKGTSCRAYATSPASNPALTGGQAPRVLGLHNRRLERERPAGDGLAGSLDLGEHCRDVDAAMYRRERAEPPRGLLELRRRGDRSAATRLVPGDR